MLKRHKKQKKTCKSSQNRPMNRYVDMDILLMLYDIKCSGDNVRYEREKNCRIPCQFFSKGYRSSKGIFPFAVLLVDLIRKLRIKI